MTTSTQPPTIPARGRPVDLRLFPAALTAWTVAGAGVRSTSDTTAGLAGVLGVAGLVLLAVLVLLHHMVPQSRRIVTAAAHLSVCCVAGAAVALSTWQAQHGLETTGWPDAVEAEIPLQVALQVTGTPRETQRPGPDGASRATVRVTVLQYVDRAPQPAADRSRADVSGESAAAPRVRSVDAEAVLLLTEEEARAARTGDHLDALVRPVSTEAGDRATALLIPFGDGALRLGDSGAEQSAGVLSAVGDRWGQVRQAVRVGTVESSAGAPGDGPELLPGLILGDRSGQSRELTEAMRAAGMTHLTVVSGTHCALVMGSFLGLLRLLRAPRAVALLVSLLGLILYVGLVDPAPSVIRAAVMGALGALALFSGRRRVSFSLLCVCVLAMLIWDPWFAVAPAMQLSAAATAGIILTGAPIQQALARVLPGVVAGPAALAISAQLFVTPVLLPMSGGITTYTVPANLLASPLLPFATVPGLLGALLSAVWPAAAGGLLWLCGLPAAAIGWIGRRAASLPQAVAPWPDGTPGAALVGLYLVVVVLLTWRLVRGEVRGEAVGGCEARSREAQEGALEGGDRRAHRRVHRSLRRLWRMGALVWSSAALLGALTALVLPGRFPGLTGVPEGWSVVMCDVGQGDMLVVRSGPARAVVVDAGEEPHRADACLTRLGVEAVDTLFITHEHLDHYGGVPGVVEGRTVREVLYGGSAGWTPRQEPMLESALEGVSVRRAWPGEVSAPRSTAEGLSEEEAGSVSGASLVSPRAGWQVWLAHEHYPGPNDNSLVVLFELVDGAAASRALGSAEDPLRLLATGDLEEDAARLALRTGGLPDHVDILKVAHHGAANGGTETLEHTRPPVALIGVGRDNDYGHPAPSIRSILGELGTAVYRTDHHGTVVICLRAGEIEVGSLGQGPD
ncbi:ComEC/Rec2 family competence protein [Nesterenkonia suensis]